VQVLRIVTLGSETGKGGFFPEGLNGKINSPVGFNVSANAFGGYPGNQVHIAKWILSCVLTLVLEFMLEVLHITMRWCSPSGQIATQCRYALLDNGAKDQ
jgi:hypothetical protein